MESETGNIATNRKKSIYQKKNVEKYFKSRLKKLISFRIFQRVEKVKFHVSIKIIFFIRYIPYCLLRKNETIARTDSDFHMIYRSMIIFLFLCEKSECKILEP